MRFEMSGYAALRADVRTVADLRELVQLLNKNKVRDDADVDFDRSNVWITVAGDMSPAEFIECGDHYRGDEQFDVILTTHEHKYNGPDNYEEAREMAESKPYKTETWRMYQDRLNRYGDDRRPE